MLEAAYLFLNLCFANNDNFSHVGMLLSLLVPLCSLVVKISSFVKYTSTYDVNEARRILASAPTWSVSGSASLQRKDSVHLSFCVVCDGVHGCSITCTWSTALFGLLIRAKKRWENRFGYSVPTACVFGGVLVFPSCHFEPLSELKHRTRILKP